MNKMDIKDDKDMLEYVLSCILATVERYAVQSRHPLYEVKRQCNIADMINSWLGDRPVKIDSRRYNLLQHNSALAYYQHMRDAS